MKKRIFTVIIIGVIIMGIYSLLGAELESAFNKSGTEVPSAFDKNGNEIFPDTPFLPVPSGDLTAASSVPLPDLYETGKGFTCTGLAYDEDDYSFLIGDIGILTPGGTIQSQIVRLSSDFTTVKDTIVLYSTFTGMGDVQGITIDTSDGTLWFCAPSANKIYHTNTSGANLGNIAITRPTGIAYDPRDNTFWVLTYGNKILHVSKTGNTLASYDFSYMETLDQCFLDYRRGYLYITAGANYSSRNNVYLFNTNTHAQSITCTVNSYSVEGIWIGPDSMIIVNDGYYHSATVAVNQADFYDLSN